MGVGALLACLLLGCGPTDISGSWSGTWRTTLLNGDLDIDFEQDGDVLSGSFDLDGTGCVGYGDVDGDIERRNITATLANTVGGAIDIDADVNAGESRITGSFEVVGGWCEGADGRITLDRN